MKLLKYALGIIAILIVLFLLLGMIKPKIAYDAEITVEKPLAESWAVSQDETKMPEWLPGFLKVEHLSGTPGAVGSVSNVHFDNNGKEMVIRETIMEIVPDESITMTFEDDFMFMDYKLSMSKENGKTKISSTTEARGNGVISRSMMALMGGMIKGQEETNLTNLKTTIENNTKVYARKE